MEAKNILVCGAGAVGVYFGGKLAQSGHHVSVVARSDYEVASKYGYDIESYRGDFIFRPEFVLRSAEEYAKKPDYVILSSKVLPSLDRSKLLAGAIKSPTCSIVLIQNGIEIEQEIQNAFPANNIISGVAYIGAARPEQGRVKHTGAGNLIIGDFPDGVSGACSELAAMFCRALVPCEAVENIEYYRWKKLLWNLPYNPVSVLAGNLDTGEMTRRDEIEKLTRNLMREVCQIAATRGFVLSSEDIEKNVEFTRNFPPYKSSMLQDFEADRPLEVEAILGNTLRIAQAAKVSVPAIECCYALLKSLDIHRRRELR